MKLQKSSEVEAIASLKSLKAVFECSICTSQFENPMQLNCGHIFCKTCIKSMKNPSKLSCPLCKKVMVRRACSERNDVQELLTCCNQLVQAFEEENRKMNDTSETVADNFLHPMCDLSKGDLQQKTDIPCYRELPDLMDEEAFSASASPFRLIASQMREPELLTKNTMKKKPTTVRKNASKDKHNKSCNNKNGLRHTKNTLKTTTVDLTITTDTNKDDTSIDEPVKANSKTYSNSAVVEKATKTVPVVNKSIYGLTSVPSQSQSLIQGGGVAITIANHTNHHEMTESELPLDLSMPKQLDERPVVRNTCGIQFIKPLDLSCKKNTSNCGPEENLMQSDSSRKCNSLITNINEDVSIQDKTFNPFDSEFDDMIGKNIDLSNCKAGPSKVEYPRTSTGRGIVNTKESQADALNKSLSMKTPKRRSQNMGKRILSLEDMYEEQHSNKIQKLGIHDEVHSELKIVNRELQNINNQTEETYFSEEMAKNNDSESDSEVLFLPETPVQEKEVKRSSLRAAATTKTVVDTNVVEAVKLPSNNRSEQFSEFPLNMFDMSFDKIGEDNSTAMEQEIIEKEVISPEKENIPKKLTPPKRYLFCPTRLSKSQLIQLQKLCEICNGQISKEYSDDVTHLIINLEQNRVPQTMKYLFAIAGKKWVVTCDWVSECLRKSKIVDENEYETANFPQCDMGVRISRTTFSPLFNEFNFFVAGNMRSSGASVEDCKKLLLQLGGNVIANPGDVNENVMIIGDPFDRSGTYQYWYKNCGWLTVSWEWILDCILTFSLVPFAKNHLITNLNGTGLSKAALPNALLNIRQF